MDMTLTVRHILQFIEQWAPSSTKMDFDNVGLLVGDPQNEVSRVLTCLDVTPAVVEEAIQGEIDLIVAHHPLIFKKLDRIQPVDEQGRMLYKLIQNDIAVIASHTNLDAARNGVSFEMARLLQLNDITFLKADYPQQKKFELLLDEHTADGLAKELGNLNVRNISRQAVASQEKEASIDTRLEGFIDGYRLSEINALLKNYNVPEQRLQLMDTSTPTPDVGMGAVGTLGQNGGMDPEDFLERVAQTFGTTAIKYSGQAESIEKVAVCGGAGVFLTSAAQKSGVQAFVTSDIKYHDFFVDGDEFLLIDIGHYESEWPIVPKMANELKNNFKKLDVRATRKTTNPVNTFIHQ